MIKLKEQLMDVKSGIIRIPRKVLKRYGSYSKLHIDTFEVSKDSYQLKVDPKRSEKINLEK